MKDNLSYQWYQDEPNVFCTVEIDGRPIRLRSTLESDAYLKSLERMTDTEEIMGSSIWLSQLASECGSGAVVEYFQYGPEGFDLGGRRIRRYLTLEAEAFAKSLQAVSDQKYLAAMGRFLHFVAEQQLRRACTIDPSIVNVVEGLTRRKARRVQDKMDRSRRKAERNRRKQN